MLELASYATHSEMAFFLITREHRSSKWTFMLELIQVLSSQQTNKHRQSSVMHVMLLCVALTDIVFLH